MTHKKLMGILAVLFFTAVGVVISETYFLSGAKLTTEICISQSWCGSSETVSGTSPSKHHRLYANIRAWGSSPNPLKDERTVNCYNCSHSGDATVWTGYIADTVTRHIVRLTISDPEYVEYTSEGPGYTSTHSCWNNGAC